MISSELQQLLSSSRTIPQTLRKSLNIVEDIRKVGLSKERFNEIQPELRKYISFWRGYPDLFVDFLQTGENGEIPPDGLRFYFYQRVFLRACLRQKYTFFVFPRASMAPQKLKNFG